VGGALRTQRVPAQAIISSVGNKSQIEFSVAEMTFGGVDNDSSVTSAGDRDAVESTQLPRIWINIMVMTTAARYRQMHELCPLSL
jgi:hypothetical protein